MTLDSNNTNERVMTTIQQEYKILAEYKMIQSEEISGVYVIPSYGNSLLWFGVIFVRQGLYKGAVFRFTISLPDKFPDDSAVPSIIFQNDIFHPQICPFTRNLDISIAYKQWQTGEDHIWQLLKFMQAIFINPLDINNAGDNLTKFSNKEAAELFQQNRVDFIEKVKDCVSASIECIYDEPPVDDPHYIVFEKYIDEVHTPVAERIRSGNNVLPGSLPAEGLSWVKEGEFKPLVLE